MPELNPIPAAVWAIAEVKDGNLRESTFEVIDEARRVADQLKRPLEAILIGNQVAHLAENLSHYPLDAVHVIEHALLENYLTDQYVSALAQFYARRPFCLALLAATPNGQDLAARVAGRLKVGVINDCIQVKVTPQGAVRLTKPAYQEKIYKTLTCPLNIPYIASLRPGVIGVEQPGPARQVPVLSWQPELDLGQVRARQVAFVPANPRTLDLALAERVVAGGRGVRPDSWSLIEELADALEASVGGSRMAADLGYIPRERMVGQTGKTVRTRLYLAVGISGVYHHLGGVQAESLIAINTDRSAPVFQQASLGIVGDLHEILPALVRRLRLRRSEEGQHGERA